MAKEEKSQKLTAEDILKTLGSSAASMSSDLGDLMGQVAGDEDWLDDELNNEYVGTSHGLRHLKCLQENSKTDLKGGSWWGLVTTAADDDRKVIYFQDPLISPVIDRCTEFNPATSRTAGQRQAWPWRPDGQNDFGGERKQPICKSTNGIVPLSMFYGKELGLPDPNTGYPVKIGYTIEGFDVNHQPVWNQSPIEKVCELCPLNKYGENVKTICKASWVWVVYLPAQTAYEYVEPAKPTDSPLREVVFKGETIILQGSAAVQKAMQGADANTSGATKDGKAIIGIDSFSKKRGTSQMVVKADTIVDNGEIVNMRQAIYVRGFALGDKSPDVASFTAMPKYEINKEAGRKLLFEQLVNVVGLGVTWFMLEVPTYPYAPEGRFKETYDTSRKMFFLRMSKVQSNFKNNPFVPNITVSDIPMEDADLAAYIAAELNYRNDAMRDKIMRTDDSEALKTKFAAGQPMRITAPNVAGALPHGVPMSDIDDDVTEAEYVDTTATELDDDDIVF